MSKRVGIYGGSFNPIHNGHIALAKQLLRACRLDEVWFVVSPQNPFKQSSELLADDKRLQLVRLALEEEPKLTACDYEFHLPKPSYMWHTLQSMRKDMPDTTFVLLIGADNWQAFPHWFRHEDIVRNFDIVIYPRKQSPVEEALLPPRVHLVHAELYDLSSTMIRQRVRCGESIDGLVPPCIVPLVKVYYANAERKPHGEQP